MLKYFYLQINLFFKIIIHVPYFEKQKKSCHGLVTCVTSIVCAADPVNINPASHVSSVVHFSDLGLQAVTRLLGISQQHRRVGLVEDGVVYCSVADAQGSFHHYHLDKGFSNVK